MSQLDYSSRLLQPAGPWVRSCRFVTAPPARERPGRDWQDRGFVRAVFLGFESARPGAQGYRGPQDSTEVTSSSKVAMDARTPPPDFKCCYRLIFGYRRQRALRSLLWIVFSGRARPGQHSRGQVDSSEGSCPKCIERGKFFDYNGFLAMSR